MIPFGNQASLILSNSAINMSFNAKDPFAEHNFPINRGWNQGSGIVVGKGIILFLHCIFPSLIRESYLNIGRFNDFTYKNGKYFGFVDTILGMNNHGMSIQLIDQF